jgi:succinate-semialdehyde dehydrogenase/glutarate-semialdehyde dehydrogenase/succinyl-CoA reductase
MESESITSVSTVNPFDEQMIAQHLIMTQVQVGWIVKQARNAYVNWKNIGVTKRAEYLHDLAHELRQNKTNLARTCTKEMGKPIKESLSEVEKCAWVMEFYADNGSIFLKDEAVNTDARKSIIAFEPIGVIGSIMPWNFPYWQALRFAAPSLIAGNTIVLKPASATLQCGIAMENLFKNIGLEDGVFRALTGDHTTAEALIDSDVNGITFTGSVSVGAKVASRATGQWKKSVLELGGSDPFIVCGDADIDNAASGAVKGRFINCGQSCIASKRFLIVKDVAKEFIEKFVQKTEKLVVGDPFSESTDIGPLVNKSALENIELLVHDAINKGADVLTGGQTGKINGKGYFYNPTVLSKISTRMRIAREEVFGPVAPITIVEDEREAIKLANDSEFGLGASIWTEDLDKAEKFSRAIESGIVTVNNVVASDPRVPFGGIKKSGFGRELSRYGLLEFVNIKSIRFYDQLVHHHHVE